MSGQVMPCSPKEIGSLFLFEKLTPEQLGRLCAEGRVELTPLGPVHVKGKQAAVAVYRPSADAPAKACGLVRVS